MTYLDYAAMWLWLNLIEEPKYNTKVTVTIYIGKILKKLQNKNQIFITFPKPINSMHQTSPKSLIQTHNLDKPPNGYSKKVKIL